MTIDASARAHVVALLLLILPMSGLAACPPQGQSVEQAKALIDSGHVIDDQATRQSYALELADCLASPDPLLRDRLAYTGLATWLRGGQLEVATRQALIERLRAVVAAGPDPSGFHWSFSMMVLSELVRADRIDPQLAPAELAAIVTQAAAAYRRIDDHRGYDAQAGWRHAPAHGADWLLQLAVHPGVGADALATLMQALASQIAPTGTHAYIHSESERQARSAYFAYQRDLLDAAWWQAWLDTLVAPGELGQWGAAFDSEPGLARRHNTLAFLHELGFAARANPSETNAQLAAMVDGAVRTVKGG
ncbi:MAG: DUF2785 domain-containing protein [Xanthomonadales bacterium]|nr:DUF2785 domain-containing protein [Xanthomonadales bacterium]